MRAAYRFLDSLADATIRGLRLNRANRIVCHLLPKLLPTYTVRGDAEIELHCPNPLTLWRAQTFFEKEPETLSWIDGFSAGDCFFDIGANVGLYSLYAAKRGAFVLAFEPESQNYALLNRNVLLNGLSDSILCLSVALSDRDALDHFYVSEFEAGRALHSLGAAVDWRHEPFSESYRQGVVSFSLDSFLRAFPDRFPTHVKLDVDGAELKVIRGADQTLRDERLRSVLVEVNEDLADDRELVSELEQRGFSVVLRAHAPMFDGSAYRNVYNYVFSRTGVVPGASVVAPPTERGR